MAGIKKILWTGAVLIVFCGLGLLANRIFGHGTGTAWGINGRISELSAPDLETRLALLRKAGIKWLREDYQQSEPGHLQQSDNFAKAGNEGFRILSLIPYSIGGKPAQPENQLHEDLRDVFLAAKSWSEKRPPGVGAWELYNEADVGFCRDLPDRSTAYMKAAYLGLKAGGVPSAPPVIMGALALPPGPWLQRAERNGLLNYADAYNFHYYGYPEDFASVLSAHRDFVTQVGHDPLPTWITECGYAAENTPGESLEQARYFEGILPQVRKGNVAAFMPYALRDPAGFSLLDKEGQPRPAWNIFAQQIQTQTSGRSPGFSKQNNPGSIVCQWVPSGGSAIPHKVSGTYRFRSPAKPADPLVMTGEIRVYNFGDQSVSGKLKLTGLQAIRVDRFFTDRIKIPARGMIAVPVTFSLALPGYHVEWCTVRFQDRGDLNFGLETKPRVEDFTASAISFTELPAKKEEAFRFHYINEPVPYEISTLGRDWAGLNGLFVTQEKPGNRLLFNLREERSAQNPPMAIALVKGLPPDGFIRLVSSRLFGRDFFVRVDLVDDKGQRFTIFENAGMSYFENSKEVWLNLKDFHLYFWGRSMNPEFDPTAVREIQLRPFFKGPDRDAALEVQLMVPAK